jgi:hypothetical protein
MPTGVSVHTLALVGRRLTQAVGRQEEMTVPVSIAIDRWHLASVPVILAVDMLNQLG